jgi:hypothetical protein
MSEWGTSDFDRQRAADHAAVAAGFRAMQARREKEREERLQSVVDSITTRFERSPQETAARLAELERRIAAMDDDPDVIDLDDLGGDAA